MSSKGGHPAYQPTPEVAKQVKMLVAMGITERDVAVFFQISTPTLRKYYMRELETGHVEANAQVAKSLFQTATHKSRPNATACIFWLKARAGWREEDTFGMGKKELADVLARVSQKGSDWDELLTPTSKDGR